MKPRRHNASVYKSGLEARFQAAALAEGWNLPYEESRLRYTIPESKHLYTPDFTVLKNVFIETKGLWSGTDRKKAILIKEQHPEVSILYVLYRDQKLSKKSTTTYLQWASKNGLEACCFKDHEYWHNFIKEALKGAPA